MVSVEELELSGNPLITIFDNSFGAMTNLQELMLSGTTLRYLKPGMFAGLDSLKLLRLHGNNLTDLSDGLFSKLPALENIQLDNNKLRTVNPCAFRDIHRIKEIWLKDNPVDCACALQWASQAGNPTIHGQCDTPVKVYKRDIREKNNYSKCKGIQDSAQKCRQLVTNRIEK